MFVIFIIQLLLASVFAEDSRIVKGNNVEPGEFPFVVSLRYKDSHTCGGTILNDQHILTAAHCVCKVNGTTNDPEPFSVQYGEIKIKKKSSNIVKVEKITCNFNQQRTIINDWAVLKLVHPLSKGNWSTVKLSETFDTSNEQKGTIVGWGKIAVKAELGTIEEQFYVNLGIVDSCEYVFTGNRKL